MKKPFFDTVVGKIVTVLAKILLVKAVKQAPFIKTDQDRKNVDEVFK
jgi:hypothetical protein